MKEIYPDPRDVGIEEFNDIVVGSREDDIREFNNLNSRFVAGRKVSKVPANSADVVASDKDGDIIYTPTAIYVLLNDSGSLVWRTAPLLPF
jgi:hypothetical protein